MKTAISLPDDVFRAAERVAKRKGMSRSEFYARAIVALLRQEDDEAVTAQLNRVYAGTDSSVDPVLAALQSRSLEREDW
jgi:metal-responsive CopG/Arc/MetJ family transcriptional regulator